MYFPYLIIRSLAITSLTNKIIFPIAINNKDQFYLKSIILIIVSYT